MHTWMPQSDDISQEVGQFFSQKYFSIAHFLSKSMCFMDLLHLKVHENVLQKGNSNKLIINRFSL